EFEAERLARAVIAVDQRSEHRRPEPAVEPGELGLRVGIKAIAVIRGQRRAGAIGLRLDAAVAEDRADRADGFAIVAGDACDEDSVLALAQRPVGADLQFPAVDIGVGVRARDARLRPGARAFHAPPDTGAR